LGLLLLLLLLLTFCDFSFKLLVATIADVMFSSAFAYLLRKN